MWGENYLKATVNPYFYICIVTYLFFKIKFIFCNKNLFPSITVRTILIIYFLFQYLDGYCHLRVTSLELAKCDWKLLSHQEVRKLEEQDVSTRQTDNQIS